MLNVKKQSGYSLIELMIALALSATVMAGIVTLFSNSLKHSVNTMDIGRLDRQLHSIVEVIASDIQRAGYWSQAHTNSTNPFMVTGSTDLTISGNCVLMTYDRDGDGSLATISTSSDDERYGYRLSGSTLQYRQWGAPYDCATAANNWDSLTDPNLMTITAFTLSKTDDVVDLDGAGAGTATNTLRKVTITLTGQLANDSTTSRTVTKTVKVFNDKYAP